MAVRGLELSGLRLTTSAAALLEKKPRLDIEHFVLRLSRAAVEALLPPGTPVKRVERLGGGAILLAVETRGLRATVEVRPGASREGRLRLEVVSVKAGIFPIPAMVWTAALRSAVPRRPGLLLTAENRIEVDLRVILRRRGVEIAPFRAVRVGEDVLELVIGDPPVRGAEGNR